MFDSMEHRLQKVGRLEDIVQDAVRIQFIGLVGFEDLWYALQNVWQDGVFEQW